MHGLMNQRLSTANKTFRALFCMTPVIALGSASLLLGAPNSSFSQSYVNGYTRSNGTYVQGHYRSSPNSTQRDNYSTKGNYNPYTGKRGSKSCGLYESC